LIRQSLAEIRGANPLESFARDDRYGLRDLTRRAIAQYARDDDLVGRLSVDRQRDSGTKETNG
jgi:nitrogen-specific signal transduction histidine kinase